MRTGRAALCHGGSWKGKFVSERKGSPGVLGVSGHQICCLLQLFGPGQLAKDHLPSSRHCGVPVPQPLAQEPCPDQELWIFCDSAGLQAQLGPLEFIFFAPLTLKILNNSRFRSSQCIWNISDSLIALISRHQPKITPCCGTALLWMEQNCTKPLTGCRDTPEGMSGRNSPVCCQPWPGQEDPGVRGSWCRPRSAPGHCRGQRSLQPLPHPSLVPPRGAEQEADGGRWNKLREAPARGWVCFRGSSTPRCSGTPSSPGWSSASFPQGAGAGAGLFSPGTPERVPQGSTGTEATPAPPLGALGAVVTAGIVPNAAPCPRRAQRGSPRGVALLW